MRKLSASAGCVHACSHPGRGYKREGEGEIGERETERESDCELGQPSCLTSILMSSREKTGQKQPMLARDSSVALI